MVMMMRQRPCHFLRSHEPGSQYVCLTGSMCALLAVCVPYWQYVCLTGSMCALLAVCVPYWQYVCLTGSMCALLAVCVPYWQYVCLTGSMCALLAVCVPYWHAERALRHTCTCVCVDIHATANTLFFTVVQGSAHSQWDRSNRKMGVVEDIDALMIAMTRF